MIVIGDNIEDIYIFGTSIRLSPEAPVPVIIPLKTERRPGGAANVVENLRALGENPEFIYNPDQFLTKTRVIANGQIICRIDDEEYADYDPTPQFDVSHHSLAVLSDYNKGVLNDPVKVIKNLRLKGIKSIVDGKKPPSCYYGAWTFKCNQKEFEHLLGKEFNFNEAKEYCERCCERCDFDYMIVTLGSRGCFGYDHTNRSAFINSAKERAIRDVTGAGDVFLAAFAHFIQSDDFVHAVKKANILAGISVEHFGTYVLTEEDVEKVKVKTVFTNGCFDILHPGHIHLLKESKKLGNKLIVGLNSDESIRRIKGPSRPILPQDQRKKMIEALGIADEVIIFNEDSPRQLMMKLKPDIITKGGDYKVRDVIGSDSFKTVIIPTLENYSTTGVINEIVRKN